MQQYNLGPNGGILTSLNLFAYVCRLLPSIRPDLVLVSSVFLYARVDVAVLGLIKCWDLWRSELMTSSNSSLPTQLTDTCCTIHYTAAIDMIIWCNRYIFFDTPGQIEIFTWSASGNTILPSTPLSMMGLCVAKVKS
jgi:hypothetical protein